MIVDIMRLSGIAVDAMQLGRLRIWKLLHYLWPSIQWHPSQQLCYPAMHNYWPR